jgi:hypothetical protein
MSDIPPCKVGPYGSICQRASLEAEIERLQHDIDQCLEAANSEAAEVERLRAENADQRRTLDAPIPWLLERDLRAEIERLRASVELLRKDNASLRNVIDPQVIRHKPEIGGPPCPTCGLIIF